jgi:hypothetical protein
MCFSLTCVKHKCYYRKKKRRKYNDNIMYMLVNELESQLFFPLMYSRAPLIYLNGFREMLISDLLVNELNCSICFAFHCRAHNLTNFIHKVAKFDEKQWTLIRLHYHTTRKAGQCDWVLNIANASVHWQLLIGWGATVVRVLGILWECQWIKSSISEGWLYSISDL